MAIVLVQASRISKQDKCVVVKATCVEAVEEKLHEIYEKIENSSGWVDDDEWGYDIQDIRVEDKKFYGEIQPDLIISDDGDIKSITS